MQGTPAPLLFSVNSLEHEEEPAGEQDQPQGEGEDPAPPGHDDPAVAAEAVPPRENFPPPPRPPRLLSAAPGRAGRRRRGSCPRFDLLTPAAVHAGVRLRPGSDLRGICPASRRRRLAAPPPPPPRERIFLQRVATCKSPFQKRQQLRLVP